MNKLEEHLRQHLAGESVPDPHEGHEERFRQRLLRHHHQRRTPRVPRWVYLGAAAALVAGFLVTLVVSEIRKTNNEFAAVRLSDISYEMAEVERFYTERLQREMPASAPDDPKVQEFTQELTRLEQEYRELEKALGVNTSNQRVIDAMVQNYRYRLQVIEMLQRYIELKNRTQPNHETVSAS